MNQVTNEVHGFGGIGSTDDLSPGSADQLAQSRQESQRMNIEILEAAAIFIQKNYRGYRTRKIVRERLRQLLVREIINNGEPLDELYDIGLGDYIEEVLKETALC